MHKTAKVTKKHRNMLFDIQEFIVPLVESVKVEDGHDDEEETNGQETSTNNRI